jgi:hypothetical protein
MMTRQFLPGRGIFCRGGMENIAQRGKTKRRESQIRAVSLLNRKSPISS